jgi:hypothetical protein
MNRSFFSTHRSSCVVLFPLLLGCGPAEPDASGWKDLPLDSGVPAGNGGVSVTDGASRAPDGASVANGGAATVDADHCASGGALHDVRAYMADGHGAELVARGPIYGAPGPASVQKLDAHCNPTWTYAVPATDTRLDEGERARYAWLRDQIERIPADARVGVTNRTGPHASSRMTATFYPERTDVDWLVLDEADLHGAALERHAEQLRAGTFERVAARDDLAIYRRRAPAPAEAP